MWFIIYIFMSIVLSGHITYILNDEIYDVI